MPSFFSSIPTNLTDIGAIRSASSQLVVELERLKKAVNDLQLWVGFCAPVDTVDHLEYACGQKFNKMKSFVVRIDQEIPIAVWFSNKVQNQANLLLQIAEYDQNLYIDTDCLWIQ